MRRWFPGRTLTRLNRLNVEKLVLALAAAWFLATGLQLLRPPSVAEWGPPRTFDGAAQVPGDLARLGPFPEGGRDPFAWGDEDARRPRRRKEAPPVAGGDGTAVPPVETGVEVPVDVPVTIPVAIPIPVTVARPGGETPPRFVGTVSVEGSSTYTIVAEGEQYLGFPPGGGEAARYALVGRAADHVLLEDSGGRLIRVPIPTRTP